MPMVLVVDDHRQKPATRTKYTVTVTVTYVVNCYMYVRGL